MNEPGHRTLWDLGARLLHNSLHFCNRHDALPRCNSAHRGCLCGPYPIRLSDAESLSAPAVPPPAGELSHTWRLARAAGAALPWDPVRMRAPPPPTLPCSGTTATAPTLSHGSTSSGTRSPSLGSTSSGSPSRCVEGRTGTLARCSCPTHHAARLPASPLSRTLPLCSGTTTRAMSSGCVGGAGGARAGVTQRAAPRCCLLGESPSPRSPSPCSPPHCLPCVQSQNRNNVRGGWGLHAHGWARARGPCTLVLCSARARAPPLSLPCTVPS